MKLLFVYSDKIKMDGILWGLLELGVDVEVYAGDITLQSYVKEEGELLLNYLEHKSFDGAITYNFSPLLSDVCQKMGIKYLSWVFDSPQIDLHTKQYYNECNNIFVFDKKYYHMLSKRKMCHLYYMPLGANITKMAMLEVTEEEEKRFAADIAFVGNLYEENMWNSSVQMLPKEIQEKIQKKIKEHIFRWYRNESIFGVLTEEDCKEIARIFRVEEYEDLSTCYYLENHFMVRKMAELERVVLLNAIGERFQVRLYTKETKAGLKNVCVLPEVSYSEEAPKIFHLTKINLNITLRSIETGIPQRVFDIMSVGGFVLSNYQEEMEELFRPGEEIVLFHTLEEMMTLIAYYLTHEEERIRIAMNGYRRVREYGSCKYRLKEMLQMSGLCRNGEFL